MNVPLSKQLETLCLFGLTLILGMNECVVFIQCSLQSRNLSLAELIKET